VTRAALRLAAGVVALEFAAAATSFVSATLLPTVATALDARAHLGLLLAGPTLGLFVALPLAPAVLHRIGPRRTLPARWSRPPPSRPWSTRAAGSSAGSPAGCSPSSASAR
jgi:hypothetical protein